MTFFEFLNIDVTLLSMPLYFLQSSVDRESVMTLPFGKVFPLLHCTFKFFDSQGSFMNLGRTPFGIQLSMVVLKTFPQLFRA